MLIQLNATRMLHQDGAQLVAVATAHAAKLLGSRSASGVARLERRAAQLMNKLGMSRHWTQDMEEYKHARGLLVHNEQFK